ncbi:hypothetical protein DYE48_18480 [Halobacillus trueperi]|uniref:Uncharacterized protein n=1 Tax=Halobacillus trueperi TaxID=156205 RepID=A0A3E0J1K5_9BACI|nr:hypothetical protein DYE48_18480 [Halobacillus trueperi]
MDAFLDAKACCRALCAYNARIVEDILSSERGSFLSCMEWGGWEAARLPWEKEIGEIPQDAVRGSSALPHRKASSFPTTPDS